MKRHLRLIIISFTLANFLLLSRTVYSQSINGVVNDHSNQYPLAGAEISIQGTQTVTITDENGAFELKVQKFPVNISVRYLGYESYQTIITEEGSHVIIGLEASNIQ